MTATPTSSITSRPAIARAMPASRSSVTGRANGGIDWAAFTGACATADIVVADRRLPRGCRPRWLKLDAQALARTGGLAIYLGGRPRIDSVAQHVGGHPWREGADQ